MQEKHLHFIVCLVQKRISTTLYEYEEIFDYSVFLDVLLNFKATNEAVVLDFP